MVKLHVKRTRSTPAYTLTTHRHQKMTYTAFYVASAVSRALDASGFLTNGFSKACTGQKESPPREDLGNSGLLFAALCCCHTSWKMSGRPGSWHVPLNSTF